MATNLTDGTSAHSALGWQPGCTTRGTWDIIWTCTQIIFLCSWVSVCANCPSPQNGAWDLFRDKCFFVLLTFLGPEIVLVLAFGQYYSAKASIVEFESLGYVKDATAGYDGWTLTHGFYADMGGIHVQPKPSCDWPKGWKSFPVDAKQLAWLVRHDYLQRSRDPDEPDYIRNISLRSIQARSKVDGLAKFITVVQTLNFFATTLARFVTGLHITTLEVTVLANIFVSVVIYFFWLSKPTDVEVGHDPLPLSKTIEEILTEPCRIDCGNHRPPCDYYHDTPLDFVSRGFWNASLHWNYCVNILRPLLTLFSACDERPAQRVHCFNFPGPLERREVLFLGIFSCLYMGWFIGAWDFYFPSPYEKTIWRVVVVIQVSLAFVGTVWEVGWEGTRKLRQEWLFALFGVNTSQIFELPSTADGMYVVDAAKGAHPSLSPKSLVAPLYRLWNRPCSNETGNFPSYSIPLKSLLITMPSIILYCICRVIILVEDMIALRSLPPTAFQQVDWAPYWPWL